MTASSPGDASRRAALSVARRDLLEFVRDRRTLFVTLLMPMAMYPVLALSSALGLRTAQVELDAQSSRPLAVVVTGPGGRDFALRMLEVEAAVDQGPKPAGWPGGLAIELAGSAADASDLLEQGKADVRIDVGPAAVAGLDGAGTVVVDVAYPATRATAAHVPNQLAAVMRAVGDDARTRRITAAGLPASLLDPLVMRLPPAGATPRTTSVRDLVATPVGAVLLLLALLTTTGAFYPAIDAIAGEKERGTIETLLIAPCSRGDVVTGKFLAVFAVTLATLLVNAVSIALTATVLVASLPDTVEIGLRPGQVAVCAAVTLVAFVGLAAVAAAMCLAVTSASRSTKEAQNTLTPVILLVSGLAGAALLPGLRLWTLAAVPFAGQVAVSQAALRPDSPPVGVLLLQLAATLLSAAVFTVGLLKVTGVMLADEELLFRGPDAASRPLQRPAPRRRPSLGQGIVAVVIAVAALWYAQGLGLRDLAVSLPLFQLVVMLLPVVVMAGWQRVDRAETFGLRPPAATTVRSGVVLGAAALAGVGLFLVGAAALLAVRGTDLSTEARELSERIVEFVRGRPWWLALAAIAVLPAICEELLFRGWLLAALRGAGGRRRCVTAVVIQAAIFAAFHLLPERMPQTFLLGLVAGWMTVISGSLWPAIIAHLAHNAVPVVLLLAAGDADVTAIEETARLPPAVIAAGVASLLGGIVLVAVGRGTTIPPPPETTP